MSTTLAIPARLASTRFPRKVLADLGGRPMLWHVYTRAARATGIDDAYILTDSPEVAEAAAAWGAKTILTDPDLPSGTARIAAALDRLPGDRIVNVQADEPLIEAAVIEAALGALDDPAAAVGTPVARIRTAEALFNPNVVKVARAVGGQALYFSRHPIPYLRDVPPEEWLDRGVFWWHIGVYAYRRAVLAGYAGLPDSPLEAAEKLEQLRFLEAGLRIGTGAVDYEPHAVDVPEDLERVRRIMGLG